MKKRLAVVGVAVACVLACGALWWRNTQTASPSAAKTIATELKTSAAHANKRPVDAASSPRQMSVLAKTNTVGSLSHGQQACNNKCLPRGAVGGEIVAYRSGIVPPRKKGGAAGVLREWLIRPKEGYVSHLEERYCYDAQGALTLESSREYVANQVLLTLDAETDFAAFKKAMEAKGLTVKDPLMELDKGGKIVAVMIPKVAFESVAELQETIRAYDLRMNPEEDPIVTASRLPSDKRYSGLWGMKQIEAPAAWDIGVSATNVVVAVLDTGINYFHEDLTDNIWRDTENLAFPWVRGFRSIGGRQSYEPMDDHGHGTHCAGTIAARGNNAKGVAGVTWKTRLMPIKFLNSEGKGATSDQILGYVYARQNGANIISCSFGGSGYSGSAAKAIEQLRIMGVTLVCAAGNEGLNNDKTPHYPSNYDLPNILAVASSGREDTLSVFSNYGMTSVDVAAPGEDILSTCWSFRNADACYETLSGTSMATPHVAGALALLKGEFPDDVYWQTMQRLTLNGDVVESLRDKIATGTRINLRKAMLSLIPPAPVVTATEGTWEDRVNVSWRPVKGATHYKLYRRWSEGGALSELTDWTTDCAYVDTEAEKKVGYHYYVRASKHADGADASPMSPAAVGYKTVPVEDEWDPKDDDLAGATILTPTGTKQMHGQHTLNPKDPYDWYKVTMSANKTYVFESAGAYDLYGELFVQASSNAEDRVAYDDDSGTNGNFRIQYTPEANEIVWLRVKRIDTSATAFYNLDYQIAGWTDEWDPADDTTSGATELVPTLATQTHGLHSLSAGDACDLFRVELTAGKTYVFATTGDADTYGELFGGSLAAGDLVAWNDDGHDERTGNVLNFRLVYTATESGTYYLRVKLAPSGGAAGTYTLEYAEDAASADFAFTDDETCEYVKGWTANGFFTTDNAATVGSESFVADDHIYFKWAFNETSYAAVARDITNTVELLDRNGVRLAWGHAVCAGGLSADEFYDFSTELPLLPAGAYTVRVTLNADVNGGASVPETATADNVKTFALTVVASDGAPVSLAIDGNAEVAGKATATYRCTATYADESVGDVAPRWSVTGAPDGTSVSADGTLTVGAVADATTVTLRAVFGGCLATKEIRLVPQADDGECPFGDPMSYPKTMTIRASVTIDGAAATTGDRLAVFVGTELRGHAKIGADGTATVTASVAAEGEKMTFKVFDASTGDDGAVLACAETLAAASGTTAEIELSAITDDPFGAPETDPTEGTGEVRRGRIYAKVTVNGLPAGVGDVLAVYDGSRLVGKKTITLFTSLIGWLTGTVGCDVDVYLSEETELTFMVWNRSARKLCPSTTTVTMKPGETKGSSSNRILIEANDRTRLVLKFEKKGWHLASVNVLPETPTVANVFGDEENGVKTVKTEDGTVASDDTVQLGKGYWIETSQDDAVVEVEGDGDEETEVGLKAGWNLVGYPLARAGRVENVLATALKSGLVTEVVNGCATYPNGTLTMLQPGEAYWMRASRAGTLVFDRTGMLTAALGERTYGPFGTGSEIVREPVLPTRYEGVRVTIGGEAAAYGDCVAVYGKSDDRLRALAMVEDEDGTVSFPIYAELGTELYAKVWECIRGSSDESVRAVDADCAFVAPVPGGCVSNLELRVTLAEAAKTCAVRFVLGDTATRTGGGELEQTVAYGGAAVAPQISVAEGFVFAHWDAPLDDVRTARTITAVYRAADAVPEAADEPESARTVAFTFDANGGEGAMPGETLNYDATGTALSANQFTHSNDVFLGWATTASGHARAGATAPVWLSDGASASEIAAALGETTGETTLYAQWGYAGYKVTAGTMVANAGKTVSVPIAFDTAKALACVSVRIAYDPSLLVLTKVSRGNLADVFDDDFTVRETALGTVNIGLFATSNVVAGAGTLARLTFAVRDGTEGRFSDVTLADVQLGEATGVRDVTDGEQLTIVNGMVRIMAAEAEVERLEQAQTVAAETVLGRLALSEGDGIQASDAQTAVVVSNGVSGVTGAIPVAEPPNGWAGGRYELLKTPTTGLTFALEGRPSCTLSTEQEGDLTVYIATLAVAAEEIPVACEGESLTAGTMNQVRHLIGDAMVSGVSRVEVTGPSGKIALIADLGISPACTVDATGVLRASYSEPEIKITSFDPQTGVVRIKVTPGEGNAVVSEIATGYLHVYGTNDLSEKMKQITKVGFDLTPYLQAETKGEAVLNVTLGTHTFLKVVVEP